MAISFDDALKAEGVTGRLAELSRSIYMQESGGGRNTNTSNAGAHGGMQIIPSTFKSVADKGWDINNPMDNMRAGIRYLKQLDKKSGGISELTAVGYYGGPGGMAKAKKGIAVSDPRNPKAPNTLEYGKQVVARMKGGTKVDVAAQGQLAEPRATPVPPSLWNGASITGGAPQPPNPVSMAAYGQAPSEPLPVEAPVVEPVMAAPVPSTPINYGLVNPQAAQQPMAQEQSIPTQKYDPMQALLALLTEPEQQPQQNFGGMGAWA